MNNIYIFRLWQTLKFGWIDAKAISIESKQPRFKIYSDILRCFIIYRLRSVQYQKEHFWSLEKKERQILGNQYRIKNISSDKWMKEFYMNAKFLNKWKDYQWHTSGSRYHKRLMAYTKRYNMGKDCIIHYDVVLERNHGLDGFIKIGNKVLLGKHVYIDYSGEVLIEDNVKIAAGVSIESHHRDLEAYTKGREVNIPTCLVIAEGAYIGTHAIILDSCNYIGRNARVGAGAVVTKDVPDYAVVVGVPAKVIKILPHEE